MDVMRQLPHTLFTPLLLCSPYFDGLSPCLNCKLNPPPLNCFCQVFGHNDKKRNKCRCQRHTGERQPFQQMVPGKPDTSIHKKGDTRVSPCTNTNSKWTADFNKRSEGLLKLGEVTEKNTFRIQYGQGLSEKDYNRPENNSRNWQMGLCVGGGHTNGGRNLQTLIHYW